ncbi:MAG: hypothetical protein RBS34_17585, partial [Desulfofustis sp.]|nr:hypothetical protein [Desulfofustis sp.]
MALWTPAEIDTELWFMPADAANVTLSGSTVTSMSDLSGNGRTATKPGWTGTTSYQTNQINGYNCTYGDGDALTFSSLPIAEDMAVLCVAYRNASRYSRILGSSNTSAAYSLMWDSSNRPYIAMGGSASGNLGTLSVSSWLVISSYRDAIVQGLRLNGALHGSEQSAPAVSGVFDRVNAMGYSGGWIKLAEMVVCATEHLEIVEGYLAHKYGLDDNLDAGHPYKSAAPTVGGGVRLSFEQLYRIDPGQVRLSWFQDYALLHYLRKDFFGLYGIRFGAAFVSWYSDLPVVRRRFVAAYRALPSVRRARVLGYGDAGVVRLSVVQEYLLRAGVLRGFCARYRIAEEELRAAHVAAYRLREFDGVRRGPQLPYVLAADTTLEEGACSFYLPEIGLQLHPFHWEIDQDGGQHYISVELQLPDQAEAVQCRKHLRLVATADGDEFETVISTPVRRTVSPGATIYVVEA